MKRKFLIILLSFVCALCFALGLSACGIFDSGGGTNEDLVASEGLEYTLSSDGTYYTVSGIGTCTDTDIVISSTYNGLPVTSIGNKAFSRCYSLTSVTIGDGVTSIGYSAFYDCTSLTSIVIGDSVTSIDGDAFCNCTLLESVIV